jgi:hypothetical protein
MAVAFGLGLSPPRYLLVLVVRFLSAELMGNLGLFQKKFKIIFSQNPLANQKQPNYSKDRA